MLQQACRWSRVDHLAPQGARSRSHIDDVIGLLDGVAAMFDDNEGVAAVAQLPKIGQELLVVSGMQPDTGFIEDVKNAGKGIAELMCQPHPLHFASRQGHGGPIEGEIGQAQVFQASQAVQDFRTGLSGKLLLGWLERQLFEPGAQSGEGKATDFRKNTPPQTYRTSDFVKTAALTLGAYGFIFVHAPPPGSGGRICGNDRCIGRDLATAIVTRIVTPEALACRTGAQRMIERKKARRGCRHLAAAAQTFE